MFPVNIGNHLWVYFKSVIHLPAQPGHLRVNLHQAPPLLEQPRSLRVLCVHACVQQHQENG